MRYKNLAVALVAGFCSCSAFSMTWQEHLKEEMLRSYNYLQAKARQCSANEVALPKIEDPWFKKLDKDGKYAAASYLSHLAYKKCIENEKRQYSADLLNYTAEVGENKHMAEWLMFEKVYRSPSLDKTFKQTNVEPVIQ